MTCIVGVRKGRRVWLGGDRAATADGTLDRTILDEPKVFRVGEVGFGVCGLPKVIDAIKHADLPTQHASGDRRFLVNELIPAVRDVLRRLDCTFDEPPHGTCFHGKMLLAYRGHLLQVDSNFQLVSSERGYCSVGSGSSLALGSLAGTEHVEDARERVLTALEVSARGNAGVAGPFDVVVVG